MLATLMGSQKQEKLACSVREVFRKGTMASSGLDARHFISSLYAIGAFLAALLVLKLRGSESE